MTKWLDVYEQTILVLVRAPSIQFVTTGNRKLGRTATSPEAGKRIPLAWNETHEISFWQEPECD